MLIYPLGYFDAALLAPGEWPHNRRCVKRQVAGERLTA